MNKHRYILGLARQRQAVRPVINRPFDLHTEVPACKSICVLPKNLNRFAENEIADSTNRPARFIPPGTGVPAHSHPNRNAGQATQRRRLPIAVHARCQPRQMASGAPDLVF